MPSALVVGGAECVWRDAYAALNLFEPDAFFVINDMMRLWPLRIDYGITLHSSKLNIFRRQPRSPSTGYPIWSHRRDGGTHKAVTQTISDWKGSSGLFAVKVALKESFDIIVLAGIPMDHQHHIVRKTQWNECHTYRKAWITHKGEIDLYTRSMSGWTKDLLGPPSPAWLELGLAAPPDEELVRALKERTDGLTENCL